MDTKTIIETTNTKLVDATSVCTGINDTLETFVDALRDVLDNATAIQAQLSSWSADDFAMLPIALREAGFDSDAVVSLVEIYHRNKRENAKLPSVLGTVLDVGAQKLLEFFQAGGLDAFVAQVATVLHPDTEAHRTMPFEYFLQMLESYAAEGDEVCIELLRLYRDSVASSAAAVKENGEEIKENA
jgi:hypothetical protein